MTPTLSVKDLAREIGRTPAWLYMHWQTLVTKKALPPPIIEHGGLVWSRAQVYAVLDRNLTAEQRATAAAFRAALEAVHGSYTSEASEIAGARERLARRFPKTTEIPDERR